MIDFQIDFLDHVAIRVRDIQASAQWYEKVLGLKKYQLEKWGAFPVFLLAGKSGIALFPERQEVGEAKLPSADSPVDHFAFQVSRDSFEKAQQHLNSLDIPFEVKDHHYFISLYLEDPDGHTVELTAIQVDAASFYAK